MSTKQFRNRPRKRFGQNFLHDQNIIDRIIDAINPGKNQHIIEIGPGKGAITGKLLAVTDSLRVIEIDRNLAAILRTKYGSHPGFILYEADVLKFDFNEIECPEASLRILGNLPYNISTPLIFHLLNYHSKIQDMVFMLQREVVNRLAAGVGHKNYGRLSLMVQYYCQVEPLFKVPPTAFHPQPKVESAMVKLTPYRQLPVPAKDIRILENVIRTAFSQRRKTIKNSLKTLITVDQLQALNIDINYRPENLSLHEYVRISDRLLE